MVDSSAQEKFENFYNGLIAGFESLRLNDKELRTFYTSTGLGKRPFPYTGTYPTSIGDILKVQKIGSMQKLLSILKEILEHSLETGKIIQIICEAASAAKISLEIIEEGNNYNIIYSGMPENVITKEVRQEIIDLMVAGFYDPGTSEYINIYWGGRLGDIKFLSRLYDLSTLGSKDSRFTDAYGDISIHREAFHDWEDEWVFDDERFELRNGSDETFLKFFCEMFHPAVRDEKKNWRRLLELINGSLCCVGYEIFEKPQISGKALYVWRRTGNQNIVIQDQAKAIAESFNTDYMNEQIDKISGTVESNPFEAIGLAKELIESCCKTILKRSGLKISSDEDLNKLVWEACNALKLIPEEIDDAIKTNDTVKRLVGNLTSVSQSLAELRNLQGRGHGKVADFKGLTSTHAKLAVGASVTVVHFLWNTYKENSSKAD